jgi:hypothetical protein
MSPFIMALMPLRRASRQTQQMEGDQSTPRLMSRLPMPRPAVGLLVCLKRIHPRSLSKMALLPSSGRRGSEHLLLEPRLLLLQSRLLPSYRLS